MFKFKLKKLIVEMQINHNNAIFTAIRNHQDLAKLDDEEVASIIDYAIKTDKDHHLIDLMLVTEGDNLSKIIEYISKNDIDLYSYLNRSDYQDIILAHEDEFRQNAIRYNNKSLLLEVAYALFAESIENMGKINSIISRFLNMTGITDPKKLQSYKELNTIKLENLIMHSNPSNICSYLLWIEPEARIAFISFLISDENNFSKIAQILKILVNLNKDKKEPLKADFLSVFQKITNVELRNKYLITYHKLFHKFELNMSIIDSIIKSNLLNSIKELMQSIKPADQNKICETYLHESDLLIIANLACTTTCSSISDLIKRVLDSNDISVIIYMTENISNYALNTLLKMLFDKGTEYYVSIIKESQKQGYSKYLLMIDFIFNNHLESSFPLYLIDELSQIRDNNKEKMQYLT